MTEARFRGSLPPLVTPFENGDIDLPTFRQLVRAQLDGGSHGVVVNGTTGEPSTLTLDEREELVRVAVTEVAGRVPVIAATGSQSLAETLRLTGSAAEAGADAVLVVTPYYIKPPQRGIVEYMAQVADSVELPTLLYHIPGRAAVDVSVDTVLAIRDRSANFVGIKHASTDVAFVAHLVNAVADPDFSVLVGLEDLSLPMLSVGAHGMVNALANVVPEHIVALYEAVRDGDLALAQQRNADLLELNSAIFWDTNPIPLKYLMKRRGLLPSNEHRLPMVPASSELEERLDDALLRAGLLPAD